jgi:PmbA protein
VSELADLAEKALEWMRGQAPGQEVELYLARSEERGLELREGHLDGISQSISEGAGLRSLSDGKMGFASCGGVSLEAIQELWRRASAQRGELETDPDKTFARPGPPAQDDGLSASIWDESLFAEPLERILPRLQEMEGHAKARDKRISSILRVGYGESRGEVVIASSLGVRARERGGSASVALSAMAKEGAELQIGSAFQASRRREPLDFARVAGDAGSRSVALLGSKKLPSGRRAVVMDPWIAGEFLDLVESLLCADQVQRGKSLLAGKVGERVGSERVTFIDDPRRPGGIASSLYDDEGCPTLRKVMVDKGILKDFFYDTYSANKDKRSGNASASRGSYKSLPAPGGSNFYLAPGPISREALLEDTPDGILVLDIMGMHMADPISGELSVGVSGVRIEKGRLTHPVKAAMISGNVAELLGRIDAVADDLTFYGAKGAPTFRIAHMTVA